MGSGNFYCTISFSGRTKDPKLNTIRSVVHCLGFTLDDLVEEPGKIKQAQLNHNEEFLVESFRQLSDQGKEYILQTMNMALNTYKKHSLSSDAETKIS